MKGFIDVASFLATTKSSDTFGELADKLGSEIYVDLNGWHLYLKDIRAVAGSDKKMSDVLASSIGPKIVGGVDEMQVLDVLRILPLKIGGGK